MNKKHLSVVMAGAMLATSVAPVLAADAVTVPEYTLAADQTGLLMEGVRNLMNSEKFEAVGKGHNVQVGNSTYAFKVDSAEGVPVETITYNAKDVTKLAKLPKGSVVTILKHDTAKNEFGEISSAAQEAVPGEAPTYETAADLKKEASKAKNANVIEKAEYDEKNEKLVVTLKKVKNLNAPVVENETLTVSVGDKKLNWNKPLAENGKDITEEADAQKFAKFAEVEGKDTVKKGEELAVKEIAKIKIATDATAPEVKDTYLVEDLFDGLLLTEKGDMLADAMADKTSDTKYKYNADLKTEYGVTSFTISVTNKKDATQNKTITVRGLDEDQAQLLVNYLSDEQVDVLAGSNRYETAVKIAKEQSSIKAFADKAGEKNIVLVNGEALVDGLAAAPFASAKNAPVLLTEANGLPSATRAYLKELIKNVQVGKISDVKINLIGGEAVLSQSLVDELEGYGFTVVRFGGDNREETSLAVAKELKTAKEAFVVGANGEADAMSIAPVAASKKAPIIVSKSDKGLSKDGVYAIKDMDATKATILGGEGVVPAETQKALEEVKDLTKVERIAGSNRQNTNALVMKEFYNLTNNVIVAKDGQKNKAELVDALTAANLASKNKAPIVLATDKLSNEQINQLNLKGKQAKHIYQVGYGVNRTVLAKVAQLLNLPQK